MSPTEHASPNPEGNGALVTSDEAEALRALFAQSYGAWGRREILDLEPLQARVRAYVRASKALGEPPQRVIVAVKSLTIGVRESYYLSPEEARLRDAVLQWCLDEYYGPVGARPAHRDREITRPREDGRVD